jgi:2-amino-4-hydroxy-6-hydroxymethyldihydropteridine diphosphokinase
MRNILLAAGANCAGLWGSPEDTLVRAISELNRYGIHIITPSSLYDTAPIGSPGQASYLNAVVLARSALPPTKILAAIQWIERAAGRRPRARWAPRPLDIDILDDRGITLGWRHRRDGALGPLISLRGRARPVSSVTQLIVPHPRLHQRAFVLVPLLEIDPTWRHPVLGVSGRALLLRLGPQRRGVRRAIQQWPLIGERDRCDDFDRIQNDRETQKVFAT